MAVLDSAKKILKEFGNNVYNSSVRKYEPIRMVRIRSKSLSRDRSIKSPTDWFPGKWDRILCILYEGNNILYSMLNLEYGPDNKTILPAESKLDPDFIPGMNKVKEKYLKELIADESKQLTIINNLVSGYEGWYFKDWKVVQDPFDPDNIPKEEKYIVQKGIYTAKYLSHSGNPVSQIKFEVFRNDTSLGGFESGVFDMDKTAKTLKVKASYYFFLPNMKWKMDWEKDIEFDDMISIDGYPFDGVPKKPVTDSENAAPYQTEKPSIKYREYGFHDFEITEKKIFKIVGPNGNLFRMNDGVLLDLGDIEIVRKETIKNTAVSEIVGKLKIEGEDGIFDEEYQEFSFMGAEETKAEFEAINPEVAVTMMIDLDKLRYDPGLSGGGSMTGKVNTKYTKNGMGWGTVKKGMSDKELLLAMVSYIEGGYYYPAHSRDFSKDSQDLYKSSGETLWGIDRYAGQTEKSDIGKSFWGEVDKISGYGKSTGYNGYSRSTSTSKWNYSLYSKKSNAWSYNHSPRPGSKGYDVMYKSFVKLAVNNLNDWLDTYIGNHPVKNLILDDSRFKFLWFRATWNGPGWFSWYANGRKSVGVKGIKWGYDNVTKDVDELIIWDLNSRLKFGNTLINHDVAKMSELLGIK